MDDIKNTVLKTSANLDSKKIDLQLQTLSITQGLCIEQMRAIFQISGKA